MKKYSIFTIGAILVIVFLILSNIKETVKEDYVIKYIDKKDENGVVYPFFNDREIDKKIGAYLNATKYDVNIINNRYINILFKSGEYSTFFYDNKTKKEISLDTVIKDMTLFYDVIYEQLLNKYPKFIGGYIKENGFKNINFLMYDNEMIIYFDIKGITPELNEEINIYLNYNDIKDLLNFDAKFDEKYVNRNIYTLDPKKKTVALTFDDGPSSQTLKILNILNDNHANATFFLLGQKIEKNLETIKSVLSYGNEFGNHSYNHKKLTKITIDEFKEEIDGTAELFSKLTGSTLKYMRPPYGMLNSEVKEMTNYPILMWNIDSLDWSFRNAEKTLDEILDNISNKSIILMHDTYSATRDCVELLLPELYARGYQVVTVSKLMEFNNKTLTNGEVYRSAN